MNKYEAMKLALEALNRGESQLRWAAITAIEEALAQPEQEPEVCCGDYATCMKPCTPRGRWLADQKPVAWMYTSQWKGEERFITRYQSELTTYKADKVWPLYTTPPQRKPLTNEQISAASKGHMTRNGFARAIETTHGIGDKT